MAERDQRAADRAAKKAHDQARAEVSAIRALQQPVGRRTRLPSPPEFSSTTAGTPAPAGADGPQEAPRPQGPPARGPPRADPAPDESQDPDPEDEEYEDDSGSEGRTMASLRYAPPDPREDDGWGTTLSPRVWCELYPAREHRELYKRELSDLGKGPHVFGLAEIERLLNLGFEWKDVVLFLAFACSADAYLYDAQHAWEQNPDAFTVDDCLEAVRTSRRLFREVPDALSRAAWLGGVKAARGCLRVEVDSARVEPWLAPEAAMRKLAVQDYVNRDSARNYARLVLEDAGRGRDGPQRFKPGRGGSWGGRGGGSGGGGGGGRQNPRQGNNGGGAGPSPKSSGGGGGGAARA